jgi:hypothetical protein
MSQEFKNFGTFQQTLNFIPTPCALMNELFYEPTKHDCLQDVIHKFTMRIHPTNTQITYQHFDKINTWTSKEIFNSHIISLVIWMNIINLSIPKWRDINRGKILHWVSKMPTSQLLMCCVILKTKVISFSCHHELWADNLHQLIAQCYEHS